MVKLRGSSRDPAADLTRASAIFNACNVGFTTGQNVTAEDCRFRHMAWRRYRPGRISNAVAASQQKRKRSLTAPNAKYGLSSRMKLFFVDTFSGVGSAVAYSISALLRNRCKRALCRPRGNNERRLLRYCRPRARPHPHQHR